jgi:CheY-like chemotaxis protein
LTLAKRLVELHGGDIEVFSAGPGCGSQFTVRLPTVMPPAAAARLNDQRDDAVPIQDQPRRVLVVEDNIDSAESLAMLLGLAEHEVEVAHDGPSALDIAANFKPEVVILDVGLPGLDGFEVARRLRQQPGLQRVQIVGVSGYGHEEYRNNAHDAGFDRYLTKPVDYEVLRESINGGAHPPD